MNRPPRALVVDDEPDIRELLVLTLGRMGLHVDAAATLGEAVDRLGEAAYDFCLTDMRLPDGSGQELVEFVARQHPTLPIAVITAFGSVDAAVLALKSGAFDFVSKPLDLPALRRLVEQALKLSGRARDDVGTRTKLLGDSPAMQQVRQMVAKVARSQAPVFISGESGVGKELVARMIHEQGPRHAGPFVPVNCGAIPSELMESEFFGHVKGSFTGAHADKEGLFQAANGGTLFLDEVAELPLPMQVKLLRVIQEKAVRAVGARQEVPVDVRILSATHKPLAALVESGAFRQDLYYRINVIELRVPPLRERREDIARLADHILDRIAPDWGVERPTLSQSALEALLAYDFHGNVRELENILERAVALCDGNTIDAADLHLPSNGPNGIASGAASSVTSAAADTKAAAFTASHGPTPLAVGGAAGHPEAPVPSSLVDYVENLERDAIMKALNETRWNKTQAAKRLGITFRALRYKLKKLGIDA
jgi:two-component system response regulator PilR (NtrC family)